MATDILHDLEVDRMVEQLVTRRKAMAITQKDVASRIGVTRANMCSLEKGNFQPATRTLVAWADALGLELCLVSKSVSRG
jgi:transcriptional regulator with XRE-family HTH domain